LARVSAVKKRSTTSMKATDGSKSTSAVIAAIW
jgi:hypothetical protein